MYKRQSLHLSINEIDKTTITPANNPIIIAVPGNIKSAPAVIPTSPPKTPFINIVTSKLLYLAHVNKAAPIPPAAAARHVVTRVIEP